MEKKILLSKEKKTELEKELKLLEGKKRKEIAETLENARQNDLSEDTDDIGIVFQEKEAIEARILEIKDVLANAEIISKTRCDPHIIQVGSEVIVKMKDKKQSLRIVSSLESDPFKGYISDRSPLGKVLLKSRKGELVKVKVNGNSFEYEILDVC